MGSSQWAKLSVDTQWAEHPAAQNSSFKPSSCLSFQLAGSINTCHCAWFSQIDRFVWKSEEAATWVWVKVAQLCPTLCNSMDSPWNSPGQNRVGSHSLLQGIFLTQGSNLGVDVAGRFFISWATREARISRIRASIHSLPDAIPM